MARPERNTVDYFPHYISNGKKMFFIEQTYGNDGYATWFKLLEMLSATEHHFLNLNNEIDLMYISAKCRVSEDVLNSIIIDLCKLGEFNTNAWTQKILWSDKFIGSIQDAYIRRNNNCMTFESLCKHLLGLGITLTELPIKKTNSNTQSKVKDTIKKENKEAAQSEIEIFPTFKNFYDLYQKKIDPELAERSWNKISQKEKEEIMKYIPLYIASEPDKQFRRNPSVFINKKTWQNEIIDKSSTSGSRIPQEPDKGWINTVGKDKELYQEACKTWRDNGWSYVQVPGSTVRRWQKT